MDSNNADNPSDKFNVVRFFEMKNKTFYILIAVVCVLGVLSVVGLMAYTAYLHDNCSIISYIANRG